MSRYSRQELFAGIGPEGQKRLRVSRVLVVGCGALGSALSETMVRAGVGALTVVDRDFVEPSNLHRQSLFEEEDARRGLPKAAAAEARLRRLNSEVEVRGLVADVSTENADALVRGADLVLDGTDNFETRFLINDVCVRARVPWVYGACVASYGVALLVRPGASPCLRCVLGDRPAPGEAATCDTAGVVAPIVQVIAGIQAAEALKVLSGRMESLLAGLVTVDLWAGSFDVTDLREQAPSCPACTAGRFDYADAAPASTAVLCGRDAVQIHAVPGTRVDLPGLASRLRAAGTVVANDYLVRFRANGADLVVFADGRVIVKGVRDAAQARTVYAKYVGS
ncbi:MAG: ThiF family adenylyltransferase [Solirubrobacterales bacterium]